jgi:hypothetical protein
METKGKIGNEKQSEKDTTNSKKGKKRAMLPYVKEEGKNKANC